MIKNAILRNETLDELIDKKRYAEALNFFFTTQIEEWKLMRENYAALKFIEEKSFWFDGFKLKVQFNPGRKRSTFADVSEEVINKRLCFLCVENLPSAQKAILLNDYLLLCNPYPIFPQHFTISSPDHIPQGVKRSIGDFLEITKMLSGNYTLIYNGPECGASAPDHLHFQVGTGSLIPIENDIYQMKNDLGQIIFSDKQASVSSINDGLRNIIFIEALECNNALNIFVKFFECYSEFSGTQNEPLMNLLSNYKEESGFSLIVLLRSKHRPQIYFSTEPNKIMISPAAVDLGGLLITSRKKDFERLDKISLKKSFGEVSLGESLFNEFTNMLRNELN